MGKFLSSKNNILFIIFFVVSIVFIFDFFYDSEDINAQVGFPPIPVIDSQLVNTQPTQNLRQNQSYRSYNFKTLGTIRICGESSNNARNSSNLCDYAQNTVNLNSNKSYEKAIVKCVLGGKPNKIFPNQDAEQDETLKGKGYLCFHSSGARYIALKPGQIGSAYTGDNDTGEDSCPNCTKVIKNSRNQIRYSISGVFCDKSKCEAKNACVDNTPKNICKKANDDNLINNGICTPNYSFCHFGTIKPSSIFGWDSESNLAATLNSDNSGNSDFDGSFGFFSTYGSSGSLAQKNKNIVKDFYRDKQPAFRRRISKN